MTTCHFETTPLRETRAVIEVLPVMVGESIATTPCGTVAVWLSEHAWIRVEIGEAVTVCAERRAFGLLGGLWCRAEAHDAPIRVTHHDATVAAEIARDAIERMGWAQ